MSVLLGNGNGTFQRAVGYLSGGSQALSVAMGDLNGDGHPDLVVANDCAGAADGNCANQGAGQIGVLLGKGDGTFQPVVSYFSGGAIGSGVSLADVNGDGLLDAIAMNSCQELGGGCDNGSIGVLLGKGDGTFFPVVPYPASFSPISVTIADLNGDGHQDVVVFGEESLPTTTQETQLSVLLGNGDGSFQPETKYSGGGYGPTWVAIGDVNHDGKLDAIVANVCHSLDECASGRLSVFFGTGDGSFHSPLATTREGMPHCRWRSRTLTATIFLTWSLPLWLRRAALLTVPGK